MMLVLVGQVKNIRIVAVKMRKKMMIIDLATRIILVANFFYFDILNVKIQGWDNVILLDK